MCVAGPKLLASSVALGFESRTASTVIGLSRLLPEKVMSVIAESGLETASGGVTCSEMYASFLQRKYVMSSLEKR